MGVLHEHVLDGAAHEPHVGVRGPARTGGIQGTAGEVPFDGTEHQEVRTR